MSIEDSASSRRDQSASSDLSGIGIDQPVERTWLATVAINALFFLLVLVNVIRTLQHAMWRDEMGTFQIAAASASLWELLPKLNYTMHPGLWYSLVWFVTRFSSDPVSMAIMHTMIAIATWIVIFRWSPFGAIEKFLLLLSYFLFWEYFVISRSYALVALMGFAFVALQQHRPQQNFIPWLLLGALANTHVLGAIWSIALGTTLVLKKRQPIPPLVTGGAAYLVLLAFAVKTAAPAPDFGPWATNVRFDIARFGHSLLFPLGAFVPIKPAWLADATSFVARAGTAPIPHFWNPNPFQDFVAVTQADGQHPFRLMLVLIAPIAICWMIVRTLLPTLAFAMTYIGVILFSNIWLFSGSSRHHGILFLAFVGSAWMARSEHSFGRPSLWGLRVLLAVSAVGGLLTLSSQLIPFSQGRNVADWLKINSPPDAFLIGSRDAQVSTVAGYLGKEMYFLECECSGKYVVYNLEKQWLLSPAERARRLVRAMVSPERSGAFLILNVPLRPEETAVITPTLSISLLKEFPVAETDESYWVYQVRKRD
jgi:hypothetical protein